MQWIATNNIRRILRHNSGFFKRIRGEAVGSRIQLRECEFRIQEHKIQKLAL
jgi:hypothetical protein